MKASRDLDYFHTPLSDMRASKKQPISSFRINRNLPSGPVIVHNAVTREKELHMKHDIENYLNDKPILEHKLELRGRSGSFEDLRSTHVIIQENLGFLR